MKGRKPKDVNMKSLTGNAGHRPLPTESDQAFEVDSPDKPAWLAGDGSEEWDRLVDTLAPILSRAAAGMLLVACSAFSEMREAERVLATEGRFYTTTNKAGMVMMRPHPAGQLLDKARTAYHRALAELGASPVSHTRVKRLPHSNQIALPGINRFFTAC